MDMRARSTTFLNGLARVLGPHLPKDGPIGDGLRRLHRRLAPRSDLPALYRIIGEFGRTNPAAFFVQIGSNDGTSFDPLRNEMNRRRWRGVMVEPMPHIFERLRRNHSGAEGVHFENVAIADHDGTMRLFYIPESPGDEQLPPWYQGLASFSRDVVLQHRSDIPDIEQRVASIDVPCMTFDSLCRKLNIDHVDLIHTDTEGYDFEILRSIDLRRFHPKLIIFEHYHMDRSTYDTCVDHLATLGYESLAGGMDTVSLHLENLSPADAPLLGVWTEARGEERLDFRADVEAPRAGADPSIDTT